MMANNQMSLFTLFDNVASSTNETFESGDPCKRDHNECYDNLIDRHWVQAAFCIAYTIIFILGITGNVLVCFVVLRNKSMRTVTNLFITNLALSDILLCLFAVPLTPINTFLGVWVFGSFLCHLMPYALGCSVYISTWTLMSIAIDRFFVIIYPFRPRMKVETCVSVIMLIWFFSLLITMPYAVFMELTNEGHCDESWPSEVYRKAFGTFTTTLQFILPFFVIAFCYTCVSFKLNAQAKSKPGTKSYRKEELDKERKRKTNQMLIVMVSIFGISWLPLNILNIMNDYYIHTLLWKYYFLSFFLAHLLAMSSTCYNPFIYAWLNENFRKEFKQLIPGLGGSTPNRINIPLEHRLICVSEKTNNGNTDTNQDSCTGLIRTASTRSKKRSSIDLDNSDVDLLEDALLTEEVKHCHVSDSFNLRRESVKLRLINEECFDKNISSDDMSSQLGDNV